MTDELVHYIFCCQHASISVQVRIVDEVIKKVTIAFVFGAVLRCFIRNSKIKGKPSPRLRCGVLDVSYCYVIRLHVGFKGKTDEKMMVKYYDRA